MGSREQSWLGESLSRSPRYKRQPSYAHLFDGCRPDKRIFTPEAQRILKAYLYCVPISISGASTLMASSVLLLESRFISATVVVSCIHTRRG